MSDPLLQRWLRSLGYPHANALKSTRPLELQRAINYLEDTHLRVLDPAHRGPLRRASTFPSALRRYLTAVSAPVSLTNASSGEVDMHAATRFLTRKALQEAVDDDSDHVNEVVDPWDGRCLPAVAGAARSEGFARLVGELKGVLGMDDVRTGGEVEAAVAAARVVEAVLGREGRNGDGDEGVGDRLDLETLPLGFATGSEGMDRVGKVLRLLYVRELRGVQNRINEAIAVMQKVTADPKTDSRLGAVGR